MLLLPSNDPGHVMMEMMEMTTIIDLKANKVQPGATHRRQRDLHKVQSGRNWLSLLQIHQVL